MFQIKDSKQKNRNKINCKNPFVRLTSFKSYAILMAVVTTVTILIILLSSITIEEASAQKEKDSSPTNKKITLSEYTNSRAHYKIGYPAYANVMETVSKTGTWHVATHITGPEWKFNISVDQGTFGLTTDTALHQLLYSLKGQGMHYDNKKKSLTVDGKPALMVSGEMFNTKSNIIVLLKDNFKYEFFTSVSADKYNQYADLFFTMLKSFHIIENKELLNN